MGDALDFQLAEHQNEETTHYELEEEDEMGYLHCFTLPMKGLGDARMFHVAPNLRQAEAQYESLASHQPSWAP